MSLEIQPLLTNDMKREAREAFRRGVAWHGLRTGCYVGYDATWAAALDRWPITVTELREILIMGNRVRYLAIGGFQQYSDSRGVWDYCEFFSTDHVTELAELKANPTTTRTE